MRTTAIAAGLGAAAIVVVPFRLAADDAVAPVTVTATRTAQTADENLSSVSVLGRGEIQQSQAQSLPDLLANQRGVSIARSGGFGKSTSVFLRGTNSDQVLVLIDGIKAGSATAGTTAFQHLPLEQVERIEIVRGPGSSLYGSEAIGGVIQIFTRRGDTGETRVNTSAMAGSNGATEITTAISGGDDDTRLSLSAKAFETDGIDARSNGFPDDDGYTNDSVSFSVDQDIGERTTWSLRAQHAEGVTDFDNCGPFTSPSGDCEDEFAQQTVSSSLDTQITASWSMRIRAGESRDESRLFTDGAATDRFDTERREVSWQNDFTFGTQHVVTAGVDYRNDEVESSVDFAETERRNEAVFGQYQWTGQRANAQASLRYDDNEAFGEETTGSVAAGYRFAQGLRLYSSIGTGFKAPTFNDLFFPDIGFFSGNPDLAPEASETFEVGIEGGRDLTWSANVYRTEIDDLIVFDAANATVNNLDSAEITGVELAGGGTHGGWDLQASITLLDTEADTDGPNDGNQLPRRPERALNVDFSRGFGPYRFGTHVRYESERYDDAANSVELDDFALVGMRFAYQLRESLSLTASVDNLFDEQYETVDNFNELGRTAYLRLRYDL